MRPNHRYTYLSDKTNRKKVLLQQYYNCFDFNYSKLIKDFESRTFFFPTVEISNINRNLNLLICYQLDNRLKYKEVDAYRISDALKIKGHKVSIADINDSSIKYSLYDGVMLISYPSIKSMLLSEELQNLKIPVYQDFFMTAIGEDKLLSQLLFNKFNIASPKTFGTFFNEPINESKLSVFLSNENSVYVIKSNIGWCGNSVLAKTSLVEAVNTFKEIHRSSIQDQRGGAIIQEYIKTDESKTYAYRIYTLTTLSRISIIGAIKKIAGSTDDLLYKSSPDTCRIRIPIQDLDEEIKNLSISVASIFDSRILGIDIMYDTNENKFKVIEVNPLPGTCKLFNDTLVFNIYESWAESFVNFINNKFF